MNIFQQISLILQFTCLCKQHNSELVIDRFISTNEANFLNLSGDKYIYICI
jgi:hypothetical protein